MESYHPGKVLKKYRQSRGLTQAELAVRWPGNSVSTRYVQMVEAGDKHLTDQQMLRDLSRLLDIPLFEFGLSDWDPANPRGLPGVGNQIYMETLDVIDALIATSWHLRRSAAAPVMQDQVVQLLHTFEHFLQYLSPTTRLEKHFLISYAHVLRLDAIRHIEIQAYPEALRRFQTMREIAIQAEHPAIIALSLMGIGTELERAGLQLEAVEALEMARDASFGASRQVADVVHAYLARAYASSSQRPQPPRAGLVMSKF